MRCTYLMCHYYSSAKKFHIKDGTITGVDAKCTPTSERGTNSQTADGGSEEVPTDEKEVTKTFSGDAVVLATGHSARDIYYELHSSGVKLEPKGFAVGFRIEHPQVNDLHNLEMCL